jgi:hypothetical protein
LPGEPVIVSVFATLVFGKENSMATQQQNELSKQSRLELIKQRHKELILNPRDDVMDGFLEDDETFDALDEHDDLGHYDDYADMRMEV